MTRSTEVDEELVERLRAKYTNMALQVGKTPVGLPFIKANKLS